MYSNLQKYFYNQRLSEARKKAGNTERLKLPMEQIKTVGILFNATEEYSYTHVEHFAEKLKGKQVDFLGYINLSKKKLGAKNIPFTYFLNDMVSWNNVPSGLKVEQFINKKFDLLFNLTVNADDTLEYMMALSKAKFRIGVFEPKKEFCYDMMLNLKAGDKLPDLCKQIEHYLQVFD